MYYINKWKMSTTITTPTKNNKKHQQKEIVFTPYLVAV
jgi:hypothetical protein